MFSVAEFDRMFQPIQPRLTRAGMKKIQRIPDSKVRGNDDNVT
jgi:hypothetical protein